MPAEIEKPETDAITEVTRLDDAALAEAWVAFNKWQWSKHLSEEAKPHWWDGLIIPHRDEGMAVHQRKVGFISAVNRYIEAQISEEMIDDAWLQSEAHD